jgi:hypothetical protein
MFYYTSKVLGMDVRSVYTASFIPFTASRVSAYNPQTTSHVWIPKKIREVNFELPCYAAKTI